MNEPPPCCVVVRGTGNVVVNGGIWRRKPSLKALLRLVAYGLVSTKVGNHKTVMMEQTFQCLRGCLSVQEEVMSVASM